MGMDNLDLLIIPAHWIFYIYLLTTKGLNSSLSTACEEVLLILIICNLCKIEPIIGVENLWFWDNSKSSNIVAMFKMTDTTQHEIKDILIQRCRDFKKSRAYDIVKNIAGFMFFKRLKSIDTSYHIKVIDNIFNEPEKALDYADSLLSMPWKQSCPQWECHISQVAYGTCYVIFRYHHSIADGLSAFVSFLNGFENYNGISQKLVQLSIYMKIFFILVFPFHTIMCILKLLIFRNHRSWLTKPISKSEKETNCSMSSEIEIEKIKRIAKENKCSLNDVMMHFVIGSMANYQSKQKCTINPKAKNICVATYISVREETGKYYEIPLDCRVSGILERYPISSGSNNMAENLKEISRINNQNKKSLKYFSYYYSTFWVRWLLPSAVTKLLIGFLLSKFTFIYANLSGPNYQLQYGNTKLAEVFAMLPSYLKIPCSICLISYNSKMRIVCNADTGVIDAKAFMRELDEIMSKY